MPAAGIQEVANDRRELQQSHRAVDMQACRLVVDDHNELVGPADRGHRVHRPVGEVAVLVDFDHATVEGPPDDGVGQRVAVGVGRADVAFDQHVVVDLALSVLQRVT